ncbi:MAG: septum formation initiator family protein [Candidatus Peribacteria bacterium]|nr:septum formation initiator family protein [Candidatus Peribacteria bacterium]
MEKSPHNKPTYSVIIAIVAVGLVVACFIFSYLQIKNLKQEISGLQREVSSLQRKNTSLEATINSLDNSDFSIIVAQYDGSSSTSNNVSWIGERSL